MPRTVTKAGATHGATPARTASNQACIVRVLEEAGASVLTVQLGAAVSALLVGFRGTNHLLICKLPHAMKTVYEHRFEDEWPGSAYVVRGPEEALEVIGGDR